MSYGFNNAYQGLIKDTSVIGFITVALVLTAGTALLLWLGDQISQYGVGNGVSIIILAGIIARLPMEFIQVYESQIKDAENLTLAILKNCYCSNHCYRNCCCCCLHARSNS